MFLSSAVSITGPLSTYTYVSANGSTVTKSFCPSCGSQMAGTNSKTAAYMTLSLGTMDDAAGLSVEVVIFERDKPNWDHLPEGVMICDTQPDWSPER